MPSSHLILCHPLLLLPPIPPSIRVFSSESTLRIRWPKYWSFSFSINPSNEHPGLISFRMDWLDLLAVQGTLKSLFQYHSSKASNLQSYSRCWQIQRDNLSFSSSNFVSLTTELTYQIPIWIIGSQEHGVPTHPLLLVISMTQVPAVSVFQVCFLTCEIRGLD